MNKISCLQRQPRTWELPTRATGIIKHLELERYRTKSAKNWLTWIQTLIVCMVLWMKRNEKHEYRIKVRVVFLQRASSSWYFTAMPIPGRTILGLQRRTRAEYIDVTAKSTGDLPLQWSCRIHLCSSSTSRLLLASEKRSKSHIFEQSFGMYTVIYNNFALKIRQI